MVKHSLIAGAALAVLASSAAPAHHSNAGYDRNKIVKLEGTVREFQWTNPHIWIQLVVPTAKGPVEYSIEGPSPSILRRKGWKFNLLKAGDKATVYIHPLRTNPHGGGVTAVEVGGKRYDYEPPKPIGGAS